MLNSDEINQFNAICEMELQTARRDFYDKLSQMFQDAKGDGLSGPERAKRLSRAAADFVSDRAGAAFEVLQRVTNVAPNKNLHAGQLKGLVRGKIDDLYRGTRSRIDAERARLRSILDHALKSSASVAQSDLLKWMREPLPPSVRDNLIRKYDAEVDLYVRNRMGKPAPVAAQITNVNIQHSTVGAVQTGASSLAQVQQEWTAHDRDLMLRALDGFRVELDQERTIGDEIRAQLAGVVADCVHELKASAPDRGKLTDYLLVIATMVQTIPVLKSAWAAINTAAAVLGLSM